MDPRRTSRIAVAALAAALLPLAGCGPAAPAPPGPGPLSGVVRDSQGAPVALASVIASTPQRSQPSEVKDAVTAADGSFDFGLVAPVEWVIVASETAWVAIDTVKAPATGLTLVLCRPAVARGRATVHGASSHEGTTVVADAGFEYAITDTSGYYTLGGLPAGPRDLYFLHTATGAGRSLRILVPAPGDTVTVPDAEMQ